MKRTTAIIAFATTALLAAVPASADNAVYPSYMCQEDGNGESGSFFRNEAYVTRTRSGGKGRLVCPVVRRNATGKITARTSVSVTDWHPNGDVRCALSVRKQDGAPVTWKSATTNGMKSGAQKLYISGVKAPAYAPLSVECRMPVNSGGYYTRIHNYWVAH